MDRRSFLRGSTAAATLGTALGACSFSPHYDASNAEAEYPPIGNFVEVDDGHERLKLHYWEEGSGPPVVLVHGASVNLRDWTHSIAPRLAQNFRVIAFDRPGFGYSERPATRGWNPQVQARLMRAGLQQMRIEKPIIVGHSWGGALAMAWAVNYPDDIRGVVPVSAVTQPYDGVARVAAALGLDGLIVGAYFDYLRRTAADGGIEKFIDRVFRPKEPPRGYVDYIGAPLSLRAETVRANVDDIHHLNETLDLMNPLYPGLTMPIEIVHGAQDFISIRQHAIPLAQQTRNATLTVLPDVGHMAHHAAPEAIEAALHRIASA